jgi:hypothetical protein
MGPHKNKKPYTISKVSIFFCFRLVERGLTLLCAFQGRKEEKGRGAYPLALSTSSLLTLFVLLGAIKVVVRRADSRSVFPRSCLDLGLASFGLLTSPFHQV